MLRILYLLGYKCETFTAKKCLINLLLFKWKTEKLKGFWNNEIKWKIFRNKVFIFYQILKFIKWKHSNCKYSQILISYMRKTNFLVCASFIIFKWPDKWPLTDCLCLFRMKDNLSPFDDSNYIKNLHVKFCRFLE